MEEKVAEQYNELLEGSRRFYHQGKPNLPHKRLNMMEERLEHYAAQASEIFLKDAERLGII